MRSSSLAYSASGFGVLTIAPCTSLGMAAPILLFGCCPIRRFRPRRGRSLNGVQHIPGQNNPERASAATPPRSVSRGPGLACVPRIGRVPGAGLSGFSVSGGKMRWRWRSIISACGAVLGLAALSAGLLSTGLVSSGASAAPLCDEYNPYAPARTGEITLDATDFADEDGTEMLSFIETQSLGKVDVEIVRAIPARSVRDVSAVPEISMMSPNHGERLKGIKIAISLTKTKARQPVRVVLKLRQVCAKHFRNTFLYY